MISIQELTGRVRELSPLPPAATKLSRVLSSPMFSVEACVDSIRYDQALTLETLKFANAASEGVNREITSIREAVVRLGGGRILKEILARHLKKTLNEPLAAYGYGELELWRHSVAAASAAEALGAHIPSGAGGLSFTAALLHDVGKLILARTAPRREMEAIWKKVSVENCTCEQAEKTVLGFSHAEVGAEILTAWNMPESIVSAVRNHHAETAAVLDPMTDVVMVANLVARSIGEGVGYEGLSVGIDAAVGRRMGLTKEIFEGVCASTACRMREISTQFTDA
jgi:putative nucleotidyltransferase with HDIG domain